MSALVEHVARNHYGALLGAAHSVVCDRADAEDAVQRALATGVRLNGTLREESAVAYLATCARNEALHLVRERSRFVDGEHADSVFERLCDPAALDVFDTADGDPRAERVRAAFAALKPEERVALREFFGSRQRDEGSRYRAIGRRHGWTYTKVNRLLAEGMAELRRAMAGPFVVTVYVDRVKFPTRREAIVQAVKRQRGEVVDVRMRKLRAGRECDTRGRARADGYLGEPVWRVEIEVHDAA